MKKIRKRLTYANVMSSIAVFLVIGGATAFAALGKNTVGTKQLKNNAVTTAKIKKEAVSTAKIKKSAVTGDQVKDGSLTGTDINASTLGTVPKATAATTATHATSADSATNAGSANSAVSASSPSTLPSGKTEYGTIGAEAQVAGGVEIAANAQLPFPAPVALDNAHVLVAPKSQCTGSAESPSAAAGYVCIYPYFEDDPATGYVWGGEKSKYGFQMSFSSTGVGDAVFANWAYTAP